MIGATDAAARRAIRIEVTEANIAGLTTGVSDTDAKLLSMGSGEPCDVLGRRLPGSNRTQPRRAASAIIEEATIGRKSRVIIDQK